MKQVDVHYRNLGYIQCHSFFKIWTPSSILVLPSKQEIYNLVCTTEALEIKAATNSVCLQRIVVQSYGVWFRSVWVQFRSVWCECMVCGLGVYGFPRVFCGTNQLHYTNSGCNVTYI